VHTDWCPRRGFLLLQLSSSIVTLRAFMCTQIGGPEEVVLQQLATLFALTHIEATMGDYLEDGYMTGV